MDSCPGMGLVGMESWFWFSPTVRCIVLPLSEVIRELDLEMKYHAGSAEELTVLKWADELMSEDALAAASARWCEEVKEVFKKESKHMHTVRVLKTDNGFRGRVQESSEGTIILAGEELFNRQFHPYPKGTVMSVTIQVSRKGRRMVKKVAEITGAEVEEISRRIRELSVSVPSSMSGSEIISIATGVDLGTPISDPMSFEVDELIGGGKMVVKAAVRGRFETHDLEGISETERASLKPLSREELGLPKHGDDFSAPEKKVKKTKPAPLVEEVEEGKSYGYYVSYESRLAFNTALRMSAAKEERAVKLMMVGQSGYGKTSLPKLFAELAGKAFLRMNCATIRDPEEWFGFREAREGSTVFVRSQFATAIEKGDLVVVMDEFNRLEPWLHNTLFPLLDDDGVTVVHDQEFRIGPRVIVVGTINTGYRYTGTFELDEALMNRFDLVLEVGAMPHAEEVKVLVQRTGVEKDDAIAIVKMCNTLRTSDVVCSTRTSLLVASMVCSGMTKRDAFEYAVVRRVPVDTGGNSLRKSVVDMVNVQLGSFEERTLPLDLFSVLDQKGSVKKEIPVQDSAEPSRRRITLRTSLPLTERKNMGMVGVISGIRKLVEEYSIKDAKEIFNDIRDGKLVTLLVSRDVSEPDLESILQGLKSYGVEHE